MKRTLGTWGPAAIWAAVLFLLSAMPDVPGSGLLTLIPNADKAAHLVLYGVLGAALAWANHRRGATGAAAGALAVGAGALFGVSDEWHQSFVPGRQPSPFDLAADVAGLTLGYALATRLLRRP